MPESREFFLSKLYILESLPELELKTGRRLLDDLIHYNYEINKEYIATNNSASFFEAFQHIKAEVKVASHYPIIHLEMHGSTGGLSLASGQFVGWKELYEILKDINILVRNNLVLTLAVCRGAFLSEIIKPTAPSPFLGLIAPIDEVISADLLQGFTAFYQELFTSADVDVALTKLRTYHLDGYRLIDVSLLYDQVYDHYRQFHLSPNAVEDRINNIVNRLRSAGAVPMRMSEAEARKRAKRSIVLRDQDNYKRLRDRFLMIDIYPENKKRF